MVRPSYEVFALRYATHRDRTARSNFIAVDVHDAPMPLDYFVWVIRDPIDAQRTIVVDTGMDAKAAARRQGRVILSPVEEMLKRIDVDPRVVRQVVLTHMHFDHAGCIDLFPAATFHIQIQRWLFALAAACATGSCATRLRSTMSLRPCGACMMAACVSMTVRRRLLPGSACI